MSAEPGSITRHANHFRLHSSKHQSKRVLSVWLPVEVRLGTPISSARGSRGNTDPPDSESGSLGRASRLAPNNCNALKALSAMPSLGKRISPVRFRVRAPSQSSQRSSGVHPPALSGAAPEPARHLPAGHLASMQQPADCFCKAILPEHHRLEDPFRWLA